MYFIFWGISVFSLFAIPVPRSNWTVVEKPRFANKPEVQFGHVAFMESGECREHTCKNGKWGVFSLEKGTWLISPSLERKPYLTPHGAVFSSSGKLVLRSRDGREIQIGSAKTPATATWVTETSGYGFLVQEEDIKNKKAIWRFFTPEGKSLFHVSDASPEDEVKLRGNILWVRRNGLLGVWRVDGVRLAAPLYNEILEMLGDESPLLVGKVGRNQALLNEDGRMLVAPAPVEYDRFPNQGFLVFNQGGICNPDQVIEECQGGKMGAVNAQGKMVVPPVWDYLDITGAPYFVAVRLAKNSGLPEKPRISGPAEWFLLDATTGAPIHREAFSYVEPFYDLEYTRTAKGGVCDADGNCRGAMWGLLDRKGQVVAPHVYQWIESWEENDAAAFVRDGKWGLLGKDESGKLVETVAPRYDELHVDVDAVRFREREKWGVMDLRGKIVREGFAEVILPFSHGVARFRVKNRWGLVSAAGVVVHAPTHAAICANNKGFYLFTDSANCSIPDASLRSELALPDGKNIVMMGNAAVDCACANERFGLLNAQGKMVLPARYASIQVMKSKDDKQKIWLGINEGGECNSAFECKGGKWGVADEIGHIIEKPAWSALVLLDASWIAMAVGATCQITRSGFVSCPPEARWGLARMNP